MQLLTISHKVLSSNMSLLSYTFQFPFTMANAVSLHKLHRKIVKGTKQFKIVGYIYIYIYNNLVFFKTRSMLQ